jgi:hypothetical protein
MKYFCGASQILSMRITKYRKKHKLIFSHGEYIDKVLERFKMQDGKPVSTPLAINFKIIKGMCPKTCKKRDYMSKVLY